MVVERNVLEWRLDPDGRPPTDRRSTTPVRSSCSARRATPPVWPSPRWSTSASPMSTTSSAASPLGPMPASPRRRTSTTRRTSYECRDCTGSCPPPVTAARSSRSGPDGHRRPPTLDYLAQIARAADDLGYTGVLTPTGTWCEDSWLVTAALLRETKRLKFLRGVPAELHLTDARRAEGGDVPAHLRRPPPAQHRDGRRRQRAATVRGLARPRRALRPHRRVPVGAARRAQRRARTTSRAATSTSPVRP